MTDPAPRPSATKRFATGFGYVVSPLILPPLFFCWMTWGLGWPLPEVLRASMIALVFLGLMPLGVIAWMVLRGDARSLEVRDRSKRLPAFAWSVALGIVAVMVASFMEWPQDGVIPPVLAIFPINSVFLAAINSRTKISVHSASIAATASLSLWMVAEVGHPAAFAVAAAFLTPAVMWSRVAAGAHTRTQVVLGAIFGLLLPLAELLLFRQVGWLLLV